jgi:hypothetical protein
VAAAPSPREDEAVTPIVAAAFAQGLAFAAFVLWLERR